MPKSKKGGTSYWGTAGIFVSNNEEESEESKKLYEEVTRNWADEHSLQELDFIMKQKIESMPRILDTDRPMDLNKAMNELQSNTLAALGQTLIDTLRTMQADRVPVTTKTSKNGKLMVYTSADDLANTGTDTLTNVENFLNALKAFNDSFNSLIMKKTEINYGDWEKVKSRFYLKYAKGTQIFKAAADRIFSGQADWGDYGRIYGLIRGQFGSDIGKMMEGVIADILNMPQIQQKIFDVIDADMADMAHAVVQNTAKGAALEGTLRHTYDISFTQKKTTPQSAKTQGDRLSDNRIILTPTNGGAQVEIGLSAKNLNFYSSFYKAGQVDIGSISLGKFAPVFSNISVSRLEQRTANKGQYALYGYRALNANHKPDSPMLSYLLAHRVAEIAFGSALDGTQGQDFAPLMSINGKLWNTKDYLLSGEYGGKLRTSVEAYPSETEIPQTWWLPENALSYVSQIHKAKLKVQLRFGQGRAINQFMK